MGKAQPQICLAPECNRIVDYTVRSWQASTCCDACQVDYRRAYDAQKKREKYNNDEGYRNRWNAKRRTPEYRDKVRESNRIAKQKSRKRLAAHDKFKIRRRKTDE